MGPMKRGRIYWASVPESEHRGHEQFNEGGSPRSWMILSDGRLETRAGLVVACPITTSNLDLASGNMADFRLLLTPDMVSVAKEEAGIKTGVLLVDQLRAMSVERFAGPDGKLYGSLGMLKEAHIAKVEERIIRVLRLPA
jgi:mRNA-degrading endonuclease toxin of MazEF toxin-antitoxin module